MISKSITKPELRKQYQSMGQPKQKGINVWHMNKDDLIKLIQKTEGNTPCYKGSYASTCGQTDCAWYKNCKG